MVELGLKVVQTEKTVFDYTHNREEYASDILERLRAKAKHAVACDLFSERLVLNASFLVSKEGVDSFSDEVVRLKEKYQALKFLYSGPWAPHNFVYIRIGTEGVDIKKKTGAI